MENWWINEKFKKNRKLKKNMEKMEQMMENW